MEQPTGEPIEALSEEELDAQEVTPLPEREVMTLIDPGLVGGQLFVGPAARSVVDKVPPTDASA